MKKFACRKFEWNIGDTVESEETLCNKMETKKTSHILVTGWVQVGDVRLL